MIYLYICVGWVRAFSPQSGLFTYTSKKASVGGDKKSLSQHEMSATLNEVPRLKRTNSFTEWAKSNDIQIGGLQVGSTSPSSGLGLIASQNLKEGDLLVTVPSKLALTVQNPGEDNSKMLSLLRNDGNNGSDIYRDAPWFVQLSLQLNALDMNLIQGGESNDGINMKSWLESLPRKFDTPIHWPQSAIDELQYRFMSQSVSLQKSRWETEYTNISQNSNIFSPSKLSFDNFVWGCECARSRAFSGAYSGSAFNPAPYAFTLLLVAVYLGLGFGTMEQAANGAAVVVCASILKDFVLPKWNKSKKYVICPFIDMANHVGMGENGEVAFEYFSDAYSLAVKKAPNNGEEFFISYGPRSNDQLLQYYGFVEKNNPHDVYIMPPLREWDIDALEKACGRTFSPGRLQKLDRAGLLGLQGGYASEDTFASNEAGGVVITRAGGVDPAVIQALRALVSSDEEWDAAGQAVGNFALEYSGGQQNERLARLAAKTAIEMELASKPTTIAEDEELLRRSKASKSMELSNEETLAVMFRIEKKKILEEIIKTL